MLDQGLKTELDHIIHKEWAQSTPGTGCIFIHPDGSFLNIYPKLDDHEDLAYWLEDQGYSENQIVEDAAWFTDQFGYIRCRDSIHMTFVALPDQGVTNAQLDSLECWMEEKVSTDSIEVFVENTNEFQNYSTEEYFPEDIIKRIRRFYSSGTLYENQNIALKEAKKKKKKQKALGWWQTFTPDAGNVLFNNAFFNHVMGNTTTDEFAAEAGEALAGDCGAGLGESLQQETYFRVEVFCDGKHVGGLFRGLNDLMNQLYDADDPFYVNLNQPLSELKYKATFPKNFDNKDAIFAYKEDKYEELEETILDLQYALNEIGWDIKTKEISRPKNIVYEDDEQIAYILENINETDKVKENMNKDLEKSYVSKETSYDLAYEIAQKAKRALHLPAHEVEMLEHDINNLRANEWVDVFDKLSDRSEVKKLFFTHCVELETEDLDESIDWNNVQWGVHQFSTESIIFRGTEEECQTYIDDRPELWDDAEVYFMTPDDPHYIKPEEKQPLDESGDEKVYKVIVKYKDEPAQKLEARIAKNRKDLEYQLSTDPDVEWYDFDEKQFNEDKEEKQICCICGKEFDGYGNNAEPVKAGKCCDDCNIKEVIPARLSNMKSLENKSMTEIFQNLNKLKK